MRAIRKFSLPLASTSLLLSLALCFSVLGSASAEWVNPRRHGQIAASGAGQIKPTTASMMTMPLVAPLFVQDAQFSSTLFLVNASNVDTYATVTIRSLSGQTIIQKRIPLAPSSPAQVAIRQLLQEANSEETYGSVIVEQSPDLRGLAVLAQLSITYQGSQASYVDEELAMPDAAMGSSVLRGVARGGGEPILVAISSLSETTQQIQVDCLGRGAGTTSNSVELGPGATVITEPCERSESSPQSLTEGVKRDGNSGPSDAFGLQLTSNAAPGQFVAFGVTRRRASGDLVLGGVPFDDPKLALSSSTVFVGLPIGPADLLGPASYKPYASVANFSLRATHVTIRQSNTSGMTPPNVSSAAVREFNLEPRQTKTLELQDLQGDPALRNSFLVTSDAAPGEVVASMASTAADDKAEVHLLGKDAARTENAGVHPWSVAQGDESTLLLFNHSDQQQRMVVSIIAGKSVWRKRITLSPLETITVNINDLIKNKLEDDQHKTLPSGLLEGEIQWSMANEKTITGRLLVSNKIAGMARNFSCMTWYVLCNGASIIPSSVTLTDGDSEIFTAVYQTCTANNIGDCFGSSAGGGVSPNYGWGWSGGMSSSCGGASTCMATATAAGSQSVTATVSTTYCSFNATSQVTVTPPTATITVNFKGSKSAGDNLTFPSNRTCSQNLDLHNCPSAGTWVWNVEGNATVSDDASKWTITQSYTGRKKGYYKAANGKLVSFDNNLNVSDDNPTGFVQQPSGQKSIFWIDAPGHGYLYDNGRPIDSITQVQNFTSTVCSTTSSNDCKSVTWYFKLVVKPGAILDTANSVASFGSASTNF